ncbi:MAG: dienelactone hydrolase family protein [Bryobacterales bacterium]|nr:dienelactone hydrolase family protein [Bryobacterales bacterium]
MATPIQSGTFELRRPARYLLSHGEAAPYRVAALHGYGMTAAEMLDLTRRLLGPAPDIAALEAPNTFNLGRDHHTTTAGYNWGTRDTAEFHIELHHQMLNALMAQLGWNGHEVLLLGYSQSVGLNYRYLATHPSSVRAAVALCGGIPANWDQSSGAPIETAILHIARTEDEFFPAHDVARFEERLRRRASAVEFHLLPGRHRFPLTAAPLVQSWLRRVFTP